MFNLTKNIIIKFGEFGVTCERPELKDELTAWFGWCKFNQDGWEGKCLILGNIKICKMRQICK